MRKTVYITGADRGLGYALTEEFLKKEYTVFAGTYMPEWTELFNLKKQYGEMLYIIPLDVSDDESVQGAARQIGEHTESLDILINNAAIASDRSGTILDELYFEDIRRLFEVNTFGPLRVTHSVIHSLLKGEQKLLVNISSEAGSIEDCWRVKEFGYSMSKASVNMQSAILQNHLKEQGVKIFAIHPGWLKTYMSGSKNEDADIEAKESAEHIVELICTKNGLDVPMYLDYKGNQIKW